MGKRPGINYVVNHIDEIKTNNNLKNLGWVTGQRNTEHSLAKQVHQIDMLTGETVKTYVSASEAGRAFKTRGERISVCCRDVKKTYAGFGWKYADSFTKIKEKKLADINEEREKYRLEIQNERNNGIQRRKSFELDPIDLNL
jgi:hypothetical protein